MGTQQILLIVLSVIIVGVSIAVGISMFGSQAYISNRQAVAAELQNYSTQVLQFWKTPASLGGAGGRAVNLTVPRLASYIGFEGADNTTSSGNGSFKIINTSGSIVTLKGLGTEQKGGTKPLITTIINVESDSVGSVIGAGNSF